MLLFKYVQITQLNRKREVNPSTCGNYGQQANIFFWVLALVFCFCSTAPAACRDDHKFGAFTDVIRSQATNDSCLNGSKRRKIDEPCHPRAGPFLATY